MIRKTVLAAALAAATAAPAAAAPTIVGVEYLERVYGGCYNASMCVVKGTAIPAGKTLFVTDVSCVVKITSDQTLLTLDLASRKADESYTGLSAALQPQYMGVSTVRYYQVHQQMRFVVFPTEKPVIDVIKSKAPGDNFADCTIVGVLK